MSVLTVYQVPSEANQAPHHEARFIDFNDIQTQLAELGVQFERWSTDRVLPADADQATVIAAYQDSIDQLKEIYGFQSIDVIQVTPNHPDKLELRQKFLAEHTHDDFEVRFFIEGRALFYLHVGDKVFTVLCEQGDLISVPANTKHWFDMGEHPDFKTIRLFTTPYGWAANFTGDTIAKAFPTLDQTVASLS